MPVTEKVYPDWVQKHRTQGTTVKKKGDAYYLYKRTSRRVPGKNVFCKTFLEKNAELFGEFCISKLEKIAEVPVGHFLPTGYQCRHS